VHLPCMFSKGDDDEMYVPVQRDYVVLSKLFIQLTPAISWRPRPVYAVTRDAASSLHYTMDYGVVQPVR
jgi:hypothetical protein